MKSWEIRTSVAPGADRREGPQPVHGQRHDDGAHGEAVQRRRPNALKRSPTQTVGTSSGKATGSEG